MVQEELLPIACTKGSHSLALPVCSKTIQVAQAASELYSNRWSPKLHALCGEEQRMAVMAVMVIMSRRGAGRDESGNDDEADPYEQVGDLPHMHAVVASMFCMARQKRKGECG